MRIIKVAAGEPLPSEFFYSKKLMIIDTMHASKV